MRVAKRSISGVNCNWSSACASSFFLEHAFSGNVGLSRFVVGFNITFPCNMSRANPKVAGYAPVSNFIV